MAEKGVEFLRDIYETPVDKIDLIHHGIPDVPFADPNYYKDKFGVEGRPVLLTFGLLSPHKGIENVISALPAIVREFPNVVYIVLGATHPNLVRSPTLWQSDQVSWINSSNRQAVWKRAFAK